ncbi:YihY/virulence factor BrkB family protein [Butyrivibrio sp. DSM 10294]|uniref:YihY/virulence factor BrkB family protein n=1 Tax=Butyrivibrio sp. DSM 10294 TaxID=2972457 RepID=UPI00234EF1F8|nr:YihY/virulence factor BrkB family protein [Butyrivibrio sp. DSM 10294]MDC7294069.1 YihY/virulence factor BrkB family protein [Butyrivibrio sp. DSM 10294]
MNVKAVLIAMSKDFAVRMQKKNIAAYAGSTAFFLILSLIPLLVTLSSVLPYTTVTETDLVEAVVDIAPDFADDIMTKLISEAYEKSVAIFSISAIVTLWAGALGMLALIRGLNVIYDVDERRNYFYLRFIATLYTIAMIITVLLMLMLMVFGKLIKSIILKAYPALSKPVVFMVNFKFILVIAIATLAFALIYTYIPSAKMKFIYQLPGAVFSAIVWYVFSWLFSVYVNNTDSYSIYGSLATPAIMMFWLYTCIYIFLIGAFINRFFHPGVKALYDDHHRNRVRKNVKKKSMKRAKKCRRYNDFG